MHQPDINFNEICKWLAIIPTLLTQFGIVGNVGIIVYVPQLMSFWTLDWVQQASFSRLQSHLASWPPPELDCRALSETRTHTNKIDICHLKIFSHFGEATWSSCTSNSCQNFSAAWKVIFQAFSPNQLPLARTLTSQWRCAPFRIPIHIERVMDQAMASACSISSGGKPSPMGTPQAREEYRKSLYKSTPSPWRETYAKVRIDITFSTACISQY